MQGHADNDSLDTRSAITQILARVVHRLLQAPQNPSASSQDCLASSPETLLSVTTAVNTYGEQGEPQ